LKKGIYFFLFSLLLLFIEQKGMCQKPVTKTDSISKPKPIFLDTLKSKKSIFKDSIKLSKPLFKMDSNAIKKRQLLKKNAKDTFPKIFGIKPYLEKEKPKIVFLRSLILPGWGQITNKQYYKLPLIYGAAGTAGYFIYENNRKCDIYVAYLQQMQTNKTIETTVNFNGSRLLKPESSDVTSTKGPFSKDLINNGAKQYRRWKQGTVIGVSVGWLLFAIDANVAAHLKSFDMTDDISATIKPGILNIQGSTAAGLTLRLNIN
jgi:Family of unknown function (DUF5683)